MENKQLQISLDNIVTQANKPRQAVNNSGNDEWYTPPEIIDLVRQVFGGTIDLDPASCDYAQTWIKANSYYTIQTNGLAHSWKADSVFLNPPYSHLSKKDRKAGKKSWLEFFVDEFKKGHFKEGIILVNTNNNTQWYQDLGPHSTMLCLKGCPRISFINGATKKPGDSPGAHNTFFYFNQDGNTTQFENVFRSIGLLLKPQ